MDARKSVARASASSRRKSFWLIAMEFMRALVLSGISQPVRCSSQTPNKREMASIQLFPEFVSVYPAFWTRLTVWTRVTMGPLELIICLVLFFPFHMIVVKCAVDYLGS